MLDPKEKAARLVTGAAEKHPFESARLIIAIGALLTRARAYFYAVSLIDLALAAQAAQIGLLLIGGRA